MADHPRLPGPDAERPEPQEGGSGHERDAQDEENRNQDDAGGVRPGVSRKTSRDDVLAWLRKKGTRRTLDAMRRYGITATRAFGVPMGTLLALSKRIGADHE